MSSINQSHQGIRRNRKALLSELISLVTVARGLEAAAQEQRITQSSELELDEMVQKAFKLVNQAVKFLDVWNDAVGHRAVLENFQGNSNVPPTPPAERADFGPAEKERMQETPEPASASLMTCQSVSANHEDTTVDVDVDVDYERHYGRSLKTLNRRDSATLHTSPRHAISHRASYSARPTRSIDRNLASENLSSCHDTFLGYLGSFIGLHLQSRSSAELLATTQQSVASCRVMLWVVEAIWKRDGKRSELLEETRSGMYNKITNLVGAARDVFRPVRAGSQDEVLMPDQGKPLVDAATACVRAAGECVAESRFVLERIGDFELEPSRDLDVLVKDHSDSCPPEGQEVPLGRPPKESLVSLQPSGPPPSPPSEILLQRSCTPPPPPPSSSTQGHADSRTNTAAIAMSDASIRSTWPANTIPTTPSTSRTHVSYQSLPPSAGPFPSPLRPYDGDGLPSHAVLSDDVSHQNDVSRIGSFDVSSTSEGAVHQRRLRNSEGSAISQTSTRATSPDAVATRCLHVPSHNISRSASRLTLNDECEEAEIDMLEKSYAHELVYNKDGQISGGTLPALIERLTTHDSTPDATFVCTFYLTFRLFTTPVEFAQALIHRFHYVGDSPKIAAPVRLRVYNVFKGWLESHWRNDCDSAALRLIMPFATGALQSVLPTAGKRLAVLAEMVRATIGPLVPRLVSSMGKTNTSIAQYVAPDTPMPVPIISKSQLNALKNWKHGGASISILDFDPLELARQFTIKESRIFCSILPEELLATEWTKKSGSMAVNVRAMSTLSTDLANLVADSILQLEDPKKRATIIKQWVKIAHQCLELANYDSLIAILCSLNTSTILRLERTWCAVSSKTKALLEELKTVVEVSRNYSVLRQRLQNHVPPCLPFVGTYLTDLTFVDLGNQTTRQLAGEGVEGSRPVINFDKHFKTAKIISDLQRFQIPYRFVEIPELQTWIQDQLVRVRSSDQSDILSYYRRSLILEPREAISTRPSVTDCPTSAFSSTSTTTKEKFELFGKGWMHHSRDKGLVTPRVATPT